MKGPRYRTTITECQMAASDALHFLNKYGVKHSLLYKYDEECGIVRINLKSKERKVIVSNNGHNDEQIVKALDAITSYLLEMEELMQLDDE